MKADDIPEYATVFRRLTLYGWDYYVYTRFGDVAISKSVYEEVKLKKNIYKKKVREYKCDLRNS